MILRRYACLAACMLMLCSGAAQAQLAIIALSAMAKSKGSPGVSKDEIRLGTLQDLSGPLAEPGAEIRNGMLLRVEEINEQGGLHGRKLKLLVEDHGYDPARAAQAAQKLVNQDKVFAVLGQIGIATSLAAMPIQFDKGVINFFPATASREMYEPVHPLKFAFAVPYSDQMQAGVPELYRHKAYAHPCVLYQDDGFGREVLAGTQSALQHLGRSQAHGVSFAPGAADLSPQWAALQSSGCDLVVLGTGLRDTVATLRAAHEARFTPTFLASVAVYTARVHEQAGVAAEGVYALHTAAYPYLDTANDALRFWANKYQTRFNAVPTVFSAYGYSIADRFATAARAAGTSLTTEAFIKAMEANRMPADMFGSPPLAFGPKQRLGSHQSRLSRVEGGRWVSVSGFLSPPAAH